jgi:signal peptide peptidase SppA
VDFPPQIAGNSCAIETIRSHLLPIFFLSPERQAMTDFHKIFSPARLFGRGPLVPVVRMTGIIATGTPLRPGLCLATVATPLERAFAVADEAVAIQINSPGGSAVQSRLIFQRVRDLAREKNLRVYIFAEDVAASGGYMIACAGDEIYADASSIVGSIGVLYAAFGFTGLIEKIGVDRRVHTAGERKMALDPFQPENADDIARLKNIQRIIHQDFIELVRDRRGKKIEAASEQLFTGEFWSGRQALELGLIDGVTDLRTKMRELYGEKVRLKLVSGERGLLRRRIPGILRALDAAGGPESFAEDVISAVEARAMWAKFGL